MAEEGQPTALFPTKLPLIMSVECWENVVFTYPDEVRLHEILQQLGTQTVVEFREVEGKKEF